MDQKDSCCPPKNSAENGQAETSTACCSAAEKLAPDTCCPPATNASRAKDICPADENRLKPGYRMEPFVSSWINTPLGEIPLLQRKLSPSDHRGRFAMRWGLGRDQYSITPGLYAIGAPTEKSEVLVSANYKLSFDVLRSSLGTIDAWILVINTKGVNVWCAAGKGTFGTAEIIRSVHATQLQNLVTHRRLIVPQLGAPGVAAHLVKKGCGFSVCYGPVKASDIPDFLAADRQATEEMRRVNFTLLERTILTPVEISTMRNQILYVALAFILIGGIGTHFFSFSAALSRGSAAIFTGLTGLLSGAVLTPILLPWLPGRAFSLKGVWLGLGFAILLILTLFSGSGLQNQMALLLQIAAISSYTAMNFTGSSTYTSPSGVEKEMRLAIPCQLTAACLALGLWVWAAF